MQRQLRRLNDSMVAVALRLQVAMKVSEEDEQSSLSLRKVVAEARTAAMISNRQNTVAVELISSLKREINALKRKLKEVTAEQQSSSSSSVTRTSSPVQGSGHPASTAKAGEASFGQVADAEVDAMMEGGLQYALPHSLGGKTETATAFQQWKINKFLYSPDTPSGSLNHDKQVVDLLSAAATFAATGNKGGGFFDRTTKSIIAKQKPVDEGRLANEELIAEALNGITLPSMRKRDKAKVNIWASAVPAPAGVGGSLDPRTKLKNQHRVADAIAKNADKMPIHMVNERSGVAEV